MEKFRIWSGTYIQHAGIGCGSSDDRDDLAKKNLVVAHAHQHPNEIDDVLYSGRRSEISIANRGEHLDSPVDALPVEQGRARVHQVAPYYPRVVIQVVQFRGQVPETRKQMDQKESEKCQLEHFRRCSSQVEISEPLLELLVVLEQLENLEDPQNAKQSVQTWDSSKSGKFVDPSVLVTCEENLSREGSQEIQSKPACQILSHYVLDPNLDPVVTSFIGAEEIDNDINAEEYVDKIVD